MNWETRRERVRTMLARGELPLRPPTIWVGPAHGEPCRVCGWTMIAPEMQFQLDYPGGEVAVCRPCHGLWDRERQAVERGGSAA